MSAPTCTPAKFWCCVLLEFVVVLLKTAPFCEFVLFDVETDLRSTWPPTPRTQTPPPGWSGAGLPGADTNALPCWVRKAVLTLPMAPDTAAAAAPAGTARSTWLLIGVPVCVVVQFCAMAAEDAEQAIAKATAEKIRRPRA